MPLLYSGSGKYSGGSGRCEPLCTKVMRPPSPQVIADQYQDVKTSSCENKCEETVTNTELTTKSAMIKKRKFSFRHGKMSITDTPRDSVDPHNIYLEVEGREIEVPEDCLVNNSQHFTRVLEDINTNNKSDYLITREEEEQGEDNTFSTLSYETVSCVIDYIAAKVSDLELDDSNVSRLQHVARLLGLARVETLCKKFVRRALTVGNCLGRYALADSFLGWADTAALIETFIQSHFSQVLAQHRHQFCSVISEVELTRLLSSPDLQTVTEDEVLEAVLAWVEHDLPGRQSCLGPLLESVQLPCLSGLEVVEETLNLPTVLQCPHSVEILEQARHYHGLNYQEKLNYWADQPKPSRWPKLLVCLSYAEKSLEYYDFSLGQCGLLTEKPDWVFGAELVQCAGALFTVGGVASRQVDRYEPELDTWTDGSYPGLARMRLAHGCCVLPSPHGGLIFTAGGSAQVGGAGHSDMEWLEPGLPSECDCSLCGPTDHIRWETVTARMSSARTFTAMAAMEVLGAGLVLMVGGDQDPDLPHSTLEIFNKKTETWSAGPHTLLRRDSCRLVTLDGQISLSVRVSDS